jgi:hypothetical protein
MNSVSRSLPTMAAVLALVALALFIWAVAMWATFEEERASKNPDQEKEELSVMKRAA